MSSVAQKIRSWVFERNPGEPFTAHQLTSLCSLGFIHKEFAKLHRQNLITRVSRGVYITKTHNRFGATPPSLEKFLALKCPNEILGPSGATALNLLRLSTQVPTQHVFYTTGKTRVVFLGKLRITLRHRHPQKMILGSSPAGLALTALWELGKTQASKQHIAHFKNILSAEHFLLLEQSKPHMPSWMAKLF